MSAKKVIKGTIIYAATGVLCRVAGFAIRVINSRNLTQAEIGITQMFLPFSLLLCTISYGAVGTGIIKKVSGYAAKGEYSKALRHYISTMIFSLIISVLTALITFNNAAAISVLIAGNKGYKSLVQICALLIPFSCIHSVTSSYFIGLEKPLIPSISNILEQITRIIFTLVFVKNCHQLGVSVSMNMIMIGMLLGEIMSSVFVCSAVLFKSALMHKEDEGIKKNLLFYVYTFISEVSSNIKFTAPLAASRIIMQFISGIEAVLLPAILAKEMGYDMSISCYGVITGMCLPMLFFPQALIMAFTQALLPNLSAAVENKNQYRIQKSISWSVYIALCLGSICFLSFFGYGKELTAKVFHNTLSGDIIKPLAIICPVMYLCTTLNSIICALGKTSASFTVTMICQGMKLSLYILLIPTYGVYGYISGLFMSHLVSDIIFLHLIKKETDYHPNVAQQVCLPAFKIIVCYIVSYVFFLYISQNAGNMELSNLLGCSIFISLSALMCCIR